MEDLIFAYFANIKPPSVNIRLGKGKFGNIYKNTEYKQYAEAILLRLRAFLGRDANILTQKSLYRIDLFFTGDWYDSMTLLDRGYVLREAVGCLGSDKPDLDNLFKVCIDAVKEYVQNDDRFVNQITGYKVVWPQRCGVIIQVYKSRLFELSDLDSLCPKSIIEEIRRKE